MIEKIYHIRDTINFNKKQYEIIGFDKRQNLVALYINDRRKMEII